jgi:acetyl esterase/lipase
MLNLAKMKGTSIRSKVYRAVIKIKGIKTAIEKEFETGDFSKAHQAAAIPDKVKHQCDVSYRPSPTGRTIWELRKKNATPNRFLLYIHGGGFVHNITKYDWRFINNIIQHSGYGVVVPDYPLTPAYNYTDVFNMVAPLYEELLAQAGNKNVVLMGFSAGGGLALSLAQYAKNRQLAQPSQIVLLSPMLDATIQNPEIPFIDKYDPYIGIEGCRKAIAAYAGTDSADNYMISPINGPIEGLAPIHLFMGTHEILLPDARKLVALARSKNVHINYYEYPEMYHAWIFLNMPEAKTVFNQLMGILK